MFLQRLNAFKQVNQVLQGIVVLVIARQGDAEAAAVFGVLRQGVERAERVFETMGLAGQGLRELLLGGAGAGAGGLFLQGKTIALQVVAQFQVLLQGLGRAWLAVKPDDGVGMNVYVKHAPSGLFGH